MNCDSKPTEGTGVMPDFSLDMSPLVVLHDKKSRVWNPPAVYQSEDAAIRDLAQAAKHGRDSTTGRSPLFVDYPEDFSLFVVGYFSRSSGVVFPTNTGSPVLLSEVVDILKG